MSSFALPLTRRRRAARAAATLLAASALLAAGAPANAESAQRTTQPAGISSGHFETFGRVDGALPTPRPVGGDGQIRSMQPIGKDRSSTLQAGGQTRSLQPVTPLAENLDESAQSRYQSLSGALTSFHAQQAGLSLSEYVTTNAPQISTIAGADIDALAHGGITDLDQLSSALTLGQGMTTRAAISDMDTFRQDLESRSDLDALVARNGTTFASSLAERLGAAPAAGQASTPQLGSQWAQSSDEAAVFGAFFRDTVTSMVVDSPDMFAEISERGVADPAAWDAFNRAADVASDVAIDRSADGVVPSACFGAFVTAMGSGSSYGTDRFGEDCSPCVAAGVYSHMQMPRLFDPTINSVAWDEDDTNVSRAELLQLDEFELESMLESVPGAFEEFQGTSGDEPTYPVDSFGSCNEGGQAAQSTLSRELPNVLGQLRGR